MAEVFVDCLQVKSSHLPFFLVVLFTWEIRMTKKEVDKESNPQSFSAPAHVVVGYLGVWPESSGVVSVVKEEPHSGKLI